VSQALCWLTIDDRKAHPERSARLPPSLCSEAIAPFLHFDDPLPDQLYVVGGRNQQQEPLNAVAMFDTWHGRWLPCPGMTMPRAGCAAAALPDGRLLVIGGYDERGIVSGVLSSCEVFDPRKQTWDASFPALSRPRWGHGCGMLGGKIFIVGGCAVQAGMEPSEELMETLSSCEVYDPATGAWSPCSRLHTTRAGARLVALREHMLAAVGGCDDVFGRAEMLSSVELYDSRTSTWSLLNTYLAEPRTTAAVAALDASRIMVMGGAPSLSSVEVYDVPGRGNNEPGPMESEVDADGDSPTSKAVRDMSEGRMGCQAVTLKLPATGRSFPHCTQNCVVVVGGEIGDEDWDSDAAVARQTNSVLVWDVEANDWREDGSFPPIPTPRTAMALCVAPGKVPGHR